MRHRIAVASKEEAQALLVEKTRESREVGPTAGNRDITVRAYFAVWLPRIEPDLKFSSRKASAYALRAHINPFFGEWKVRAPRQVVH